MSSDWEAITLGEIGVIVTGKTPPSNVPDCYGSEYMFVTPRDMSSDKFIRTTERYVSELGAEKLKKQLIRGKSVCVSCIGSDMGKVVLTDKECITNQQINAITEIHNKYDPEFVYYSLKLMKDYLHKIAGGSTMPIVNKSSFSNIEIKVPKRVEQSRIVSILGSIDDKIDLNSAINKNLEEMAQAIFKRWFVDFEFPNENGQPYKSSGGEFEESELGLIPKGWAVGSIGTIAKNRKDSIKPGDIPKGTVYVGLEHVPRKKLSIDSFGISDNLESNKTCFRKNDILFGKLRPYFHKVSVAPLNGVCSTDIISVYASDDNYFGFLVAQLFSERLVDFVTQSSNGTRMPRTNWNDISRYNIAIPKTKVAKEFTYTYKSFIEKMQSNTFESLRLTQIRDTLLPKLMSGEIRVPVDREYTQIADLPMLAESSEKYNFNP